MMDDRPPLTLLNDTGARPLWNEPSSCFLDEDLSLAERTYLAVVREWGLSVEYGDRHTLGHSARVADLATALAVRLGANEQLQTTVRIAAYLHDVGRLRVAGAILAKQSPLSPDEAELMRMIPIYGTEVLSTVSLPWNINPIVRWHNERCDGSGYPDRLRAHEIPITAQMVGVANVYDALTSSRPYRLAFSPHRAFRELATRRSWWSEQVFDAFAEIAGTSYSGSLRLA